jgi:hypothetical protein
MAFHNVLRDYKHLQQENQKTYLNIFHSHSFFSLQLEMFNVGTTGDTAHIDTIFKSACVARTLTHLLKHIHINGVCMAFYGSYKDFK